MGKRYSFLIGVLCLLTPLSALACEAGRVTLRGDWGQAAFRIDVVDTPESRAQGLMFVEQMGRFEGMLFVYDAPRSVTFWMKNTLIPLDMIFADSAGVVQRVHENAVPHDLTGIPGGDDIQYVLEVNAGMARTLGIAEGTVLQHPSIAQVQAAWPCS